MMHDSITVSYMVLILNFIWTATQAMIPIPNFQELKQHYPGYKLHGGNYSDADLIQLIVGHGHWDHHNTSPLRLSQALNSIGGTHAIGTTVISYTHRGNDSFIGANGLQYIFRNTAFGPYLASKYGNPWLAKPNKADHTKTMLPFVGKQGIARLVSFTHKHAGGHIGLWDCDHFYQAWDWTEERHIISVEFWDAPDSNCTPTRMTIDEKTGLLQLLTQRLNDVTLYGTPHRVKHNRIRKYLKEITQTEGKRNY